jgi:uncharacterized protein
MSWLLDVNLILACRWTTHPNHLLAKQWIETVDRFYTSPIAELGFVRISLSIAYRATWDEVQETLKRLHARAGYRFLSDDVDGTASPETASKETTDAHLVVLAKRHGLKLATIDAQLLARPWAVGVAENPLLQPWK